MLQMNMFFVTENVKIKSDQYRNLTDDVEIIQ